MFPCIFARRARLIAITASIVLAACLPLHGQQPQLQERGGAAAPHVEQVAPLTDYQRSQMESWARDFADLHRYQAANQELGEPAAGGSRPYAQRDF